ncbi:hypothetical protein [Formosa haliotis]|uniref:hypothetical protein n=1 Tax=Formosa haliotis TaxID=1555194 RepID=UPI000825CD24|nr:hypothetical protein [Formosa haliotis]
MKPFRIIVLLSLVCFHCKEQNSIKHTPALHTEKTELKLSLGCYEFKDDKNAIRFEISKISDSVIGNLSYQLFEKDKNSGKFKGVQIDHNISGIYTFMSEGIQSKRQVVFLILNDTLVEGYGPLHEDGTTFKNIDQLEFHSSMPLTKIDCLK